MSENIMYKNIADKMKKENEDKTKIKEIIKDIKEIYYFKPLLDYITNLQTIERQYSAILSENAELQADNQELQDSNQWWNNRYNALQRDYEDYKSRCEKAVEYLKQTSGNYRDLHYEPIKIITLINILNGK